MKPRRFILSGAAFVAALMLAGPALAQGSSEDSLLGSLDLKPQLGETSLFSGADDEPEDHGPDDQGSFALIRQSGSGNLAALNQGGQGHGAYAVVAQYGEDNLVQLDQCACGNVAAVVQDGNANLSDITQSGAGNVFVHFQYGDALALSVTQYGGAQVVVTQTGP